MNKILFLTILLLSFESAYSACINTANDTTPSGFGGVICDNTQPKPTPKPVVSGSGTVVVPNRAPTPPITQSLPKKQPAKTWVMRKSIPLNAYSNTLITANTQPTGVLIYQKDKECDLASMEADIAAIGAFRKFGNEFDGFNDTTVSTSIPMLLIDKIDGSFPGGSWGNFIKQSNNLIVSGKITQAQRNFRYVNLAAIKSLVNTQSCIGYAGITEFSTSQSSTTDNFDLAAFSKNNNLALFSSYIQQLRSHPNYLAQLATVVTVDTDRTYQQTHHSYSDRLMIEQSYIKDKPAVFSAVNTLTHFDKVSTIAGLTAWYNLQGHMAVPYANGVIYGTGAGEYGALEYFKSQYLKTGIEPNGVVVIPSARESSFSYWDGVTDCHLSKKGISVVRSMSNIYQTNDEASFVNGCALSVGTVVHTPQGDVVQGTTGKYGPHIVVDVSNGLTTDPHSGLFPSFYSQTLGGIKYQSGGNMHSSQASEFVGQVIGNIMEICPAAAPQEIYRNILTSALPIADYPTNQAINNHNNNVVGGIFNPVGALKLTMVRNCPQNITTKWTYSPLGWKFDISTMLDNQLWVAAKACTLIGGTLSTKGNSTASCLVGSVAHGVSVYKTQYMGYTGYATDAKGSNARFW